MNKYRTLLLNIGLFGINTVATKLITFLLVPLYTYYLSTKRSLASPTCLDGDFFGPAYCVNVDIRCGVAFCDR